MNGKVIQLNHNIDIDEQFMMWQHSGCVDDMPQEMAPHFTVADAMSADQGDWFLVMDDTAKVVGPGMGVSYVTITDD